MIAIDGIDNRCRSQRGVTLTELMIALVIGLVVVAAVVQVFVSGKQGFSLQQGVSRAQESGRIGASLLDRTVRHAGYYRNPLLRRNEVAALFLGQTVNSLAIPLNAVAYGVDGASGAPDTLVVRFQGNEDATLLDCQGVADTCLGDATCTANPVAAPVMVTNVFSLGAVDAQTGVRSLQCGRQVDQLNASPAVVVSAYSAQPIIEGVSDLQVKYGIDTNSDRVVDRFVDAGSVTDWGAVFTIRVTLTTNSVEAVGAGASTNQRLTQTYVQTIDLRNL